MRSLVFVIIFLPLTSFAQFDGFSEVSDIASFKEKFYGESAKISSISSNFEQEKELTILSEKIISKGIFRFQREDKIRIEYTTPFYYLMIINGDRLTIKDEDNETNLNVRSNKLFQKVNDIMVESVNGTIIDNDDFSIKVFENPSSYLLQMTPTDKALKNFFNTILIYADKATFSVSQLTMNEASGDKTIIRFLDRQLNTYLDEAVFTTN